MADTPYTLEIGGLQALPEWTDSYGHMTASRYYDLFVHHGYLLLEQIGLGPRYSQLTQHGCFIVDAHIRYHREVLNGTPLRIRLRLQSIDHVRLRLMLELVNDEQPTIVYASLAQTSLHVSLLTRRTTPFPSALQQSLSALAGTGPTHAPGLSDGAAP